MSYYCIIGIDIIPSSILLELIYFLVFYSWNWYIPLFCILGINIFPIIVFSELIYSLVLYSWNWYIPLYCILGINIFPIIVFLECIDFLVLCLMNLFNCRYFELFIRSDLLMWIRTFKINLIITVFHVVSVGMLFPL